MTRPCEPLRAIWRSVAAALLLIVSAHAAAPIAEPLARTSGSAFNSATAEVSLRSGARIAAVQPTRAVEPPAPPWPSILASAKRLAVPLPPSARGPPATATIFAPLSPRAPPAA